MKDKENKISVLKRMYNLYRWLYLHNMKFISRILYRCTFFIFGCTIPPTVSLAKGG